MMYKLFYTANVLKIYCTVYFINIGTFFKIEVELSKYLKQYVRKHTPTPLSTG